MPLPFADAISNIESGGRYDLLGPVTDNGDRAHGRYQVMGNNIGPWSREALGYELSPQEFLANPQAQDAVFQHRFGSYVNKYGPEGAARAWFAGEGGMNNPRARDMLGTSVDAYGRKFNNLIGAGSLSQSQGNERMPPQQEPSLSAQFLAGGPGALFGAPNGVFPGPDGGQGYDLGGAMQGAAGWLMALDNPQALNAAMQPRDDFQLVQGADGSMYRLNKKSGQVQPYSQGAKVVQIGTDAAGNSISGVQRGANIYDMHGRLVSGPASAGSPNGGGFQDPYLAKGVTEENPELQGEDYLKQYTPEVQAYIRAKAEGRTPVTGNARKGFTQFADARASKYGEDIGVPMDAASFTARRNALTKLGSAAINDSGGQINSGVMAMGHLASLVDAFKPLHNLDPSNSALTQWVPGATYGAQLANSFGNTKPAFKPLADAVDSANKVYGGEITKYITGTRGTGHERGEAAHFTADLTPSQVRERAKMELSLMDEKTSQIIKQAADALGPNHPAVLKKQAELDKARKKVQDALSASAGTASPATPAKPTLPKGVNSIRVINPTGAAPMNPNES